MKKESKDVRKNNDDVPGPLPRGFFRKAVQGKYYQEYQRGKTQRMVTLESDVAEVFKDSESVNSALRGLLQLAHQSTQKKRKKSA